MLATTSKPAAVCQQGSTKHNVSSPTTGNIYSLIAIIALDANEQYFLKVISTDSANTFFVIRGKKQQQSFRNAEVKNTKRCVFIKKLLATKDLDLNSIQWILHSEKIFFKLYMEDTLMYNKLKSSEEWSD